MSKELAKTYDPKGIEDRLYKKWMDNGYFHAKVNPDKKPFTIVMPPPNVTGQLHMGHALDETMQDILIRFKRMQGYEALWQPGTDHAAIATEVKVTEKLRKEGIDKNEIGRDEFMKHAWAWKEEYGGKDHQSAAKSWEHLQTGSVSALPWMRAAPRLFRKYLSAFMRKAISTKAPGSSTGVRYARPLFLMQRLCMKTRTDFSGISIILS